MVAETLIVEAENPLKLIHPRGEDWYQTRTVGDVYVMHVWDSANGPGSE